MRDGTFRPERADARPYVLVHPTRALRAETVGTSTRYSRLAEALVAADRLDAVPGADDFARYRSRMRSWTGPRWLTEPTLQARWRDLVAPRSARAATHPSETRR